ncbi:MAG: LON peptidase substrate-binding domain-containing protein [Thermoleophilia bacterium]
MEPSPTPLPLFPLDLVLLPEELLPLHIFEERYKRLVARCLESEEPFGIVLRLGDGIAAVGCSARLAAVLEEFPDGRANIVVRGERPFRILAIAVPEDANREPMSATVEYLQDYTAEESEPAGAPYEGGDVGPRTPGSLERLLERLRVVRGDDFAVGDEPSAAAESDAPADATRRDPAPRSYRIAAELDLELALKERLLESRLESERLALLVGYLEALVPRLELVEARRDAIRGNGKGD